MKKIIVTSLFLICTNGFGQQPPGTDIYLFDMDLKKNKVTLSNPKNITNRSGYDNQPFFHPDKPLIYYASADGSGRTDILVYNYATGSGEKLTNTQEREYSPTVTPDKKFISCIIQRDNGAQDLGKYPIEGGEPEIIINNLTVGYHAWADQENLILFVLDKLNSLQWYSVTDGKNSVIAENIGRSLHRIPGTTFMSFVDKRSSEWSVTKFQGKNGPFNKLVNTIPNKEDLAWTPDGKILMSDGKKIFFWQERAKDWIPITTDVNFLAGITRMAVNSKGDKLAIVVSEGQTTP